ncbi:MAG TPA: HAD-IA family hydrolase [Candidatus Acidoferrum sp.]|nr:HAD-IA family hydrolase [Candidatus Acidoferrum sp.]
MLRNQKEQHEKWIPDNVGMRELVCDAVLFDLDGTLVDSAKVIERLWAEWAARHSLNVRDILAISHGRRAEETMRLIAPHLPTLKEEAAARLREEEQQSEGLVAVAGAKELLNSIPQDRWAIVTSCTQKLAEVRLQSVGLPVPAVMISQESVPQGKPHPEGYLEAARILGWAPGNCLVVEDAPLGVEAGRAAGMRVLGVTTTFSADQLSADLTVADLTGVAIVPGVPLTIRIRPVSLTTA